MHIPDGYLGPITFGFFYLIMIPLWYKSILELKKLDPRKLPLLGVLTAFSFLVMMFNLPIPDGTTAHMVGGTLIAILMDNPWVATIAISIVLVIQAIFFGDGGITCIGANCFNMGVVLPFVGYYIYKFLKNKVGEVVASVGYYIYKFLKKVGEVVASVGYYIYKFLKKVGEVASVGYYIYKFLKKVGEVVASVGYYIYKFLKNKAEEVASGIGAYIGIVAAAIVAGFEFGLQPFIESGYCPYPFTVSVPAMAFAHIVTAGPAAAVVTAIVVWYVRKVRPDTFTSKEQQVSEVNV